MALNASTRPGALARCLGSSYLHTQHTTPPNEQQPCTSTLPAPTTLPNNNDTRADNGKGPQGANGNGLSQHIQRDEEGDDCCKDAGCPSCHYWYLGIVQAMQPGPQQALYNTVDTAVSERTAPCGSSAPTKHKQTYILGHTIENARLAHETGQRGSRQAKEASSRNYRRLLKDHTSHNESQL